jgi:mannose-6-phosphate isomerase-like protein (cupin superfamily)
VNPIVHGPDGGESLTLAGNTISFKAGVAETGGAFGFLEYTAAPEFPGPLAHVHDEMSEVSCVLESELSIRVGDESVAAPAGTFVLVPPGTPHGFANPNPEQARFLTVFSPGGLEQYYKDLAVLLGSGSYDPAVATELGARYGTTNV